MPLPISEQHNIRLQKLHALKERGFNYPNDVEVTTTAADLHTFEVSEKVYHLAGRLVQSRHMGKVTFAHLLDGSGKIQLYFRKDELEDYDDFVECDLGDILEVSGKLFITKAGEKTLHVNSWRLLTKSLSPLPEKWHGLSDTETRFRERHLDLISNIEVRETFRKRAKIISLLRQELEGAGFIEVETPILNSIAGGAIARPFATHHNALGQDMFLRIAPELWLKRLVVGGLEKVYELGRLFRNEGVSRKHNPEYTSVEFYEAYSDFHKLMNFIEGFLKNIVSKIYGVKSISYQGEELDFFTSPWRRITMVDSLKEIGEVDSSINLNDVAEVQKLAIKHNIHLRDDDWGRGIEALWGELVEPKLVQPTFITHHPLSISPLSRVNDDDPRVTDRFELIIARMEIGNGFSELNDPEDQLQRFTDQAMRKAAGDLESSEIDYDYIKALQCGLPPTAGAGLGIDRLVMLLTDSPSIREVLLFPQLKNEVKES